MMALDIGLGRTSETTPTPADMAATVREAASDKLKSELARDRDRQERGMGLGALDVELFKVKTLEMAADLVGALKPEEAEKLYRRSQARRPCDD